jgi:outer membrane immunogenic protein
MNRTTFALLTAGLLSTLAAPALAADIPAPVYKAAPARVASFNWTGFYLGGSLGGRWTDVDLRTVSIAGVAPPVAATALRSADSTAFRAGVYAGYNWQLAPQWLIGVEGDIAWASSRSTSAGLPGFVFSPADSTSFKETWDGSVRGRLGYLLAPTWLVYATGGASWLHVSANAICSVGTCPVGGGSFTNTNTRSGWTVGGGVETVVWTNWLLRAEYRYADYGTWNSSFFTAPAVTVSSAKITTNTALVGLAYKF